MTDWIVHLFRAFQNNQTQYVAQHDLVRVQVN